MSKHNNIMICVTRQKACDRLINIGHAKAEKDLAKLYVVHVTKEGENYLGNPDEGQALEYLFSASKKANAEMTVMRSEDVVETLVEFAREQHIHTMILGESPVANQENSIIRELKHRLDKVEFMVVPA